MAFSRPLSAGCEMTGHVKSGVFFVDDKRTLRLLVAKLPDGPAILRIEPADKHRSLEDNRRYHGILAKITAASGIEHDVLHEYYKKKFSHKSTAALDERTFRVYVDMVMGDAAAQWGVEFPVPEPLMERSA